MFGKFKQDSIRRSFHIFKKHLTHGYNQSKHILGQKDSGIGMAKRIYGVSAPTIEQLGGGQINQHAIKTLGDYETIRNKVIDEHEGARRHYDNIVGGLAKQGISIGI